MSLKYVRIFLRGHYLFREAYSFPRAYEEQIMFKEKYPSIFSPQMEAIVFIILQIFLATRTVLKIGEYINNSRHLARNYARIFVRGHYVFRKANSFPRAKLEENCELRGTYNVQGHISELIFALTEGYCLHFLQIFFATRVQF